MNAALQDALQRYKSGDFLGLIQRHSAAVDQANCPQILLVLLAQGYLKTGSDLQAAEHYRRAGDAKGENHVSYLVISGNLFVRTSSIRQAYDVARQAVAMAPRDPQALELYHRVLLETCLFDEMDKAHLRLLDGLRRRDAVYLKSESPFGNVTWCGEEETNAALTPATLTGMVTPAMRAARQARPHRWAQKLRIGYLSDDYYENHPTMRLFQGVMVSHDMARFDVAHFCFTSPQKVATDTMRQHYPNLVRIGHLDDTRAADLIRSHDIDILIDLKGHTNGARPNLINLGLAPVQVAYIGFPGSGNGIDCDYVLSDKIVTPDSSKPFYHEKFCRLPDTYQSNDNIFRAHPETPSRASLGLPEGSIVLGFFNATRKITPLTFRLIVKALEACPQSVLWILFLNDFARNNFLAAIADAGIDPARIIFAPKAHYADHIARLGAVDIALDSFPYNGHTTTSDLLWAGVPVVTCKGTHFASRVSQSLLTALGVPELVTEDPEQYIALIRHIAADEQARISIRERISANRTTAPLFDTVRFTRHLERAFEMMADRSRRGLPPDHIDVPPIEVEP